MSDKEFDKLVEELRLIDPENQLIKLVGFGVNVFGEKEELPISIRKSLNKIHNIIDGLIQTNEGNYDFWITPKVDGFSCILKYNNGILEKAWTREGTIITEKCKYIKNLPLSISNMKGEVYLRGELFISWVDFENIKDDYANPRNALGIINRKNFENLEFVTFYFHPFQKSFKDNLEVINNSSYKDPFKISEKRLAFTSENILNIDSVLLNHKEFFTQETQIDGLVIVNSSDYEDHEIEYKSFAYKFGTEEVETEVEKIEWNPSSRGKLIPVVWYKPVTLYGTNCVKCSGFTYDYVRENKLGKGSKIKITKANEIIPYITEVLSEGEYEELTEIRSDIKILGKHAIIFGNEYHEKLRMENFIKNFLDYDGFKRSEILLDIFEIKNFKNLISFIDSVEKDYFLEKLKQNSIVTLGEEIFDKLKTNKINHKKFFSYFGIDGLGDRASEKLYSIAHTFFSIYCNSLVPSYQIDLGEEYNNMNLEKLVSSSGCNSLIVTNLLKDDVLKDISNIWIWAINNKKLFVEEDKKFNKTVVITGSLSKTKDEYKRILEKVGVKLDASISKTTDYLVADNVNGTSSKTKFANKNNIKIISEQELIELFLT